LARQPVTPVLAGTGGGIIPPQSQVKPDYKLVLDVSGGLNTSRPPDQVDDRDSPDMENLVYVNKVLCVDFGFKPWGSPVTGIPQGVYEWVQPQSQTRFFVLVTTRGAYQWTSGNWAAIVGSPVYTSDGSIPISWAEDPSKGWLLWTNGFDAPQYWDGGSNIGAIPGVTGVLSTARYIARFHGVTVLANTTEGGVRYIYRIRRSATNDSTNWTTLDAGWDDLVDTGDAITDIVPVNPYLVIIRLRTVVRVTYYGVGLQVFWYDYGLNTTGSIAAKASTATKTSAIFLAESGIFQYDGNYATTDIGEKVYQTLLTYTGEINTAATLPVFLQYNSMFDETWVFYADQYVNFPNRVMRYNHTTGAWFKRKWMGGLTLSGAGYFRQGNGVPWTQLSGSRWIDRHRTWSARANCLLFRQILLCGTNGQVYLYDFNTTVTDNGLPISWWFVSKDYPIPTEWRTVDGVVVYGKGILGLIEVSLDFGVTWHQLASNIVLGPTWARRDADCSLTCEFLRVRLSGNDPSFKLSWFAFKTLSASER